MHTLDVGIGDAPAMAGVVPIESVRPESKDPFPTEYAGCECV